MEENLTTGKAAKNFDKFPIQTLARVGFVVLAVLIFIMSSQPGEESNWFSDSVAEKLGIEQENEWTHVSVQALILGFNLRKIAHIVIFAGMSICAFLSQDFRKRLRDRVWIAILVTYAYACFDEFHQSLVPERFGSFSDTLIDLIGILLGIGIILFLRKMILKMAANHSRVSA